MGDQISTDIEDIVKKPKKQQLTVLIVELLSRVRKLQKYNAENVDKMYSSLRSETKCAPSK